MCETNLSSVDYLIKIFLEEEQSLLLELQRPGISHRRRMDIKLEQTAVSKYLQGYYRKRELFIECDMLAMKTKIIHAKCIQQFQKTSISNSNRVKNTNATR